MLALGYEIITITEDMVAANSSLNADDVGKQAVNYNGHLGLMDS